MDTKQTEALRLATESLPMLKIAASLRDGTGQISLHGSHLVNLIDGYDAALHQLQTLRDLGEAGEDVQLLRMGYDAARLEIASLHAQLAAVGAGGVSPLMPRPVFGRTGTRDVDVAAAQKAWDAAQAKPPAIGREALMDLIAERLSGTYHCTRVWSAWGVGTMSQDDFEDVGESDTPGELSDEILAAIASQAQPVGAEPVAKWWRDKAGTPGWEARALYAAPQPPAQAQDKDETKAQRLTEKRWLEVGKAVERACIELPQWAEVVVSLEKDAGTVKWFDGDGNEYDSDTHGDCFSETINNAIDAAIAAQQGAIP